MKDVVTIQVKTTDDGTGNDVLAAAVSLKGRYVEKSKRFMKNGTEVTSPSHLYLSADVVGLDAQSVVTIVATGKKPQVLSVDRMPGPWGSVVVYFQ